MATKLLCLHSYFCERFYCFIIFQLFCLFSFICWYRMFIIDKLCLRLPIFPNFVVSSSSASSNWFPGTTCCTMPTCTTRTAGNCNLLQQLHCGHFLQPSFLLPLQQLHLFLNAGFVIWPMYGGPSQIKIYTYQLTFTLVKNTIR